MSVMSTPTEQLVSVFGKQVPAEFYAMLENRDSAADIYEICIRINKLVDRHAEMFHIEGDALVELKDFLMVLGQFAQNRI